MRPLWHLHFACCVLSIVACAPSKPAAASTPLASAETSSLATAAPTTPGPIYNADAIELARLDGVVAQAYQHRAPWPTASARASGTAPRAGT